MRGKRYERKLPVRHADVSDLEDLIYRNPGIFREIYQERIVNSIYLDTLSYDYYLQSVSGISNRKKVRIRWYGENEDIPNPSLEIKKKTGSVNSKELYPFPSFHTSNFSWSDCRANIELSELPEHIKVLVQNLIPVVKTMYSRKYFLSADSICRITLDTHIHYKQMYLENNDGLDSGCNDFGKNIIELKYEVTHEESVRNYINFFPFRTSRNSKYVTALNTIFHSKTP